MAKIMKMADAVREFVHDGDLMVIGGCTTNRKPYAIVREIIKQRKKDLYLYGAASAGDIDMLIGGGCCKAYVNAYCANSGYTNVSRVYRRAIEEGKLLFEDYSLDIQSLILHTAALGLPFVAVKHQLGSDLVEKVGISEEVRKQHPKLPPKKLIIGEDPFHPGQVYCYIPAPKIDCAIIHVQKASPDGTCRIEGSIYSDLDISIAATRLIVSCEELVPSEELRRDSSQNQIASILPDAIVVAPYGAHPSQMNNYYDYDREYFRYYDKVSRSDDSFAEYLDEWVYGLEDHEQYLNKLGIKHLIDLNCTKGRGFCDSELSWGGSVK